jgi:hypothetical protein
VRVTSDDGLSIAHFEAAPGERNMVSVSVARPGVMRFRDDGAPVAAGAGCTQLAPNEAECARPADAEFIEALVTTGDGDDVLRGSTIEDELRGGEGGDRIEGGAGQDTIVPGGAQPDVVDGGAASDLVSYEERTDPLTVSLPAGRAAEDTVISIERFSTGRGADTITGTGADEVLDGGRGSDAIIAGGGNDDVFGGAGDDRLAGGDGNDRVHGNRGRDQLSGGRGNDDLFGMHDDNRAWPILQVGANTHACGPGLDRVHHLRTFEYVDDDCEIAGLVGDDPLFTLPPVRRPSDPVLIVRDIPLGGSASIRLRARSRTVARVGLRRRRNVSIRLSPLGQRMLRRTRRIEVSVDFRGVRRTGGFRFEVDV